MKLDIRFRKGDKGKPLAVFIHGLGMDADFWAAPARARVLGGRYPLSILLGSRVELKTSYTDLMELGFSILTWSQSRPAGPAAVAEGELAAILRQFAEHSGEGLFLIGHSRGGLVARKYLESHRGKIRALITLSTPHAGTSLARWAAFMSPLASAISSLLKNFDSKETETAFQRILRFLCSSGLRELLPGSELYRGLKDEKVGGARYFSVGGTDPDLLRALAVPLPKLLAGVVPEKMFPEELRDGLGDGLVSAASSVLPYGDAHRNFPSNHASIVFDRAVRDFILHLAEEP